MMEDVKVEIVEDAEALTFTQWDSSALDLKEEPPQGNLLNRPTETFINFKSLHSVDNLTGPFLCEVCDVPFLTGKQFANHNGIHRKECLPKCNLCQSYFKSFERLKSHEMQHARKMQPSHISENGQSCNESCSSITSTSQDLVNFSSASYSFQKFISHQRQCMKNSQELQSENFASIQRQVSNYGEKPCTIEMTSGDAFSTKAGAGASLSCVNRLRNVRLPSKNQLKEYGNVISRLPSGEGNDDNIPFRNLSLTNNLRDVPSPKPTLASSSRLSHRNQSSTNIAAGSDKQKETDEINSDCPDYGHVTLNRTADDIAGKNPLHVTDKRQGNAHPSLFPRDVVRKKHEEKFGAQSRCFCKLCFLKFPSEAEKNIHQITHSGIRPLTCPICCVGYAKPNHFINHVREMTGRMPFKCAQCDMSFLQDRKLIAHRSAVHVDSENATEETALGRFLPMMRHAQPSETVQQTDEMLTENSLKICFKLADEVALRIARKLEFEKNATRGDGPVSDAFKTHEKGHSIFIDFDVKAAVSVASETSRRLFHHHKNMTQQVNNDTNQIPSTSVSCSNDNTSLPPNHTVTGVPQIGQSSCEVTGEREMPGRRVKIISSDFINKATPNRIEANVGQRLLTSGTDKRQGDEHTPLFRIDEARRLHGEKVSRKNLKSISVRDKLASNISKQYVCKPCSWEFPSEADSNIHKIIHSGVPPLICPICCVGYDDPKHFIHHVRKATGRKPYKCTQCDMTFLWDRLMAHISAVHLNSENPTEQNALIMALEMNHQDQSHSSESANQTDKGLDTQSVGYKLAHKVALQISIRLGFGKDIKPKAFEAHPTEHFIFDNLNEEVAVCVASETSRRLFHHMPTLMPSQKETVRGQTIESLSSCEEIESQRQEDAYLNPNQLEQLNFIASSQSPSLSSKQYVCKPCSWEFPSEADSNIHKIIHSGVPPLICPICCVGYDNPKHFIHHVRKATGRKPYKCTQCDMTFLWDRLVAHISAVHLNAENATEQNALIMALEMNHQDQSHSSESANQSEKGLDKQSVGYKLAHKVALQISIRLGFGKDIKPKAFEAHPTEHFIFENLNEEVAVRVASETSRRLFHHMPTLMPSQKETVRGQTIESLSSCEEIESQRQEDAYLNPNQLEQLNFIASSQSLTWNNVGSLPSTRQEFPITFLGNESNIDIDIDPNDFYQCKSCSKKFLSEAELNVTLKIHNPGKEWKCKICGKCLKEKKSFDNNFSILRYGCESCTERFVTRTQMVYHINRHHSDQNFVCAICQKKVFSKRRLNIHMKVHDPNRKMYECKQCCKALTTNGGLKDHIERMHASTPKSFRCEFCNKNFKMKSNRDKHIKTHTRPVECTQCGRKFASKKQLEDHIKSHNNDRQFCCTECGKKFLTQGNLNEHFKRHIKVNRYFCDICDRGFFEASVFKRHKMAHSKEKPNR